MEAIIGTTFMASILKLLHQNLYDFWLDDGTGVEFVYNTMNLRRFKFLIRYIIFDNRVTRNDSKMYDKLAPIQEHD